MIPKIIHYCWFGGKPLPAFAKRCIKTWKKHCPDYQIKEWNETNFNLKQFTFTQEAYECKKYAFVTDVVRLYALFHEGGIYMDTDVEVIKPLDGFLKHDAFSGFEDESHIPTGIMGSTQGGEWAKEMLEYYKDRHFLRPNGTPHTNTNVNIITHLLQQKGFIPNNSFQILENYFTIYPNDYFCPKSHSTREITLTSNTHTIHHFDSSWMPWQIRFRNKIKDIYFFRKLFHLYRKLSQEKHK